MAASTCKLLGLESSCNTCARKRARKMLEVSWENIVHQEASL